MTPANIITITRILLIIPFVICVYQHGQQVDEGLEMSSWRVGAMWLFGIISVSDGLDGWVARITGKSKLGAVLDPAADKLLMLGATVSLTFFSWKINGNSLPTFWVVLVLLRDSLITLLSTSLWLKKYPFKVQSTLWAKISTIVQFLLISYTMIWTQDKIPRLLYLRIREKILN